MIWLFATRVQLHIFIDTPCSQSLRLHLHEKKGVPCCLTPKSPQGLPWLRWPQFQNPLLPGWGHFWPFRTGRVTRRSGVELKGKLSSGFTRLNSGLTPELKGTIKKTGSSRPILFMRLIMRENISEAHKGYIWKNVGASNGGELGFMLFTTDLWWLQCPPPQHWPQGAGARPAQRIWPACVPWGTSHRSHWRHQGWKCRSGIHWPWSGCLWSPQLTYWKKLGFNSFIKASGPTKGMEKLLIIK